MMSTTQKQNGKNYSVLDNDSSLYQSGIQSDDVLREEDWQPRRTEIRTRRRSGRRGFLGMPVIHPAVFSVILILLVLVVSVFAFMNAQGMAPTNLVEWIEGRVLGYARGEGYPVSVSASQTSQNNFQLLDQEPILLTDTALLMYNGSGAQVSGRHHSYASPALRTGVSRVLLYDIGSYGYRLENRSGIDYEGVADRKILTGALSSSGVYALATAGKGYASVITAYSRDHQVLYTRSLQDTHIMATDIRPDGSLLAAGGLRSDGGALSSTLLLLGFNQEDPVAKFDFSDTIILAVHFMAGGRIAVIGDRAAYLIDAAYENVTTYDYQKRPLQDYSIDMATGLALALAGADGSSCTLALFRLDGQAVPEVETGHTCSALTYTGNKLFVLSEDVLFRYSDALSQEKELSCPALGKSLLISGSDGYLLSAGSIWKLDAMD